MGSRLLGARYQPAAVHSRGRTAVDNFTQNPWPLHREVSYR